MSPQSEDYKRIELAISFICQHQTEQPSLTAVARHVGLSQHHFQKMFTRWAGISPKRFLQHLTIEHAKSLITETKSVLDLTFDVGLSGPGRLHDLFVNLEAMSPGEYKNQGLGLTIRYGVHDTQFGRVLIATTDRGICNLHFLEENEQQEVNAILKPSWTNAKLIHDQTNTEEICSTIFASNRAEKQRPLTLSVKGTNFQIQVWRALLRIPTGSLTTYKALAEMIGSPAASRAVGNALGKNPVAYLIPCHRVIRRSGDFGKFRWGKERKQIIIGWEGSQRTVIRDTAKDSMLGRSKVRFSLH